MKRFTCLLMVLFLIFGSVAAAEPVSEAGSGETGNVAERSEETAWTGHYEHDPRDNPSAMRDIVVNPDAVYGFSPSPAEESTLKDYVTAIDWTDPAQVAAAREQRQVYHDSMQELYDMTMDMVEEDQDIETIARAVSQRRNELRLEAAQNDPEALALMKKRNLETYGDEFGPTQDSLFEKYGSWEMVLIKALGTNSGMDACLGFYDEYFDIYNLEGEVELEVVYVSSFTAGTDSWYARGAQRVYRTTEGTRLAFPRAGFPAGRRRRV